MARRQPTAQVETPVKDGRPGRGELIGDGIKWSAGWGLRVALVLVSLWLIMKALAPLWVAILPLLIGLILATAMWPPTRWLRSKGLPPAAAAAITLVLGIAVLGGIVFGIGSSVSDQASELARQATAGVKQVQDWVQGPPLNVDQQQIDSGIKSITDKIQTSGGTVATGVLGGVGSAAHILVTAVLAVILAFFFIKDGPKFLPWVRRMTGERAGGHLSELLARMWRTLSGYIRAQALVSLVDAVFIGLGLLILGVPLWLPLTVLTFLGGFIPIVGATVAGALAVLVALVTTSFTKAVIVLVIVIAVQQIEGHVLSPLLQGRSMQLHPAVVILAIAIGSEMRGVIGAFLAVPAAALLMVLGRYLGEQMDLRTGARSPDDLEHQTDEGLAASRRIYAGEASEPD